MHSATIGGTLYRFPALKTLLAKASPKRSGDALAGVAASSAAERVAAQSALADLPLKVLIWDDAGQVKVSYSAPAWLAARHQLSDELAANLAGIGPLTDALIAR